MTKILALYLPQFHETPENNEWWGKGFTEWTNTRKATKLYANHYQPRVPLHENYYDLSDSAVMVQQAQMARRFGIYGFCYYHYWFNGKQMLHKPLLKMLETKEIDMPFCLSWANDSWNKAWDGEDQQILIKQEYGEQIDWEKHLQYLLPFFRDPRYIKENNRPLFFIYRTIGFSRMDEMLTYWDRRLNEEGFDGIHFVETLNSFQQTASCVTSRAVFTFEPMLTLRRQISLRNKLRGKLQLSFGMKFLMKDNYRRVWEALLKNATTTYGDKQVYRGAFVDWDNSPRKGSRGLVIAGATPARFGKYMQRLLALVKREQSNFVIINAWNEWAEGCYLEPDEKFEYAYLEALKKATTIVND